MTTRFALVLYSVVIGSICTASAVHAADAPPEVFPIQIGQLNGAQIAEALSLQCADDTYDAFASWAKKVSLSGHDDKDTFAFQTTANSVKIGEIDIEVHASSQGQLEITAGGQSVRGSDACSAALSAVKSTPDSVKADDGALVAALMAGTIGALAKDQAADQLPNASLALYVGLDPTKRAGTKIEFDRILSSNYALRCNNQLVTVQTPVHKIVIRKTKSSTDVAIFDRESDQALNLEKGSLFAKKARDYFAGLAKRCNSQVDAETFIHSLEDSRDKSSSKVALIQSGHAPASSGGK